MALKMPDGMPPFHTGESRVEFSLHPSFLIPVNVYWEAAGWLKWLGLRHPCRRPSGIPSSQLWPGPALAFVSETAVGTLSPSLKFMNVKKKKSEAI